MGSPGAGARERSVESGDATLGRVVVLGGSGGIGSAICVALGARGFDVTLTYGGNAKKAAAVVAGVEEQGQVGRAFPLRVEDAAAVRAFFAEELQGEDGIEGVVYAVGSGIEQPFISAVSPVRWSAVMGADANGFFNVVSAALPGLRRAGGALVALTSAGLYRYPKGDVLSVAPKSAIEALVRGVAVEEGRSGVRANCVAPGVIEAGMFLRLKEEVFSKEWLRAAKRNTPLERFGSADEVAAAVVFLVSRQSKFITGQTLRLDGGYSISGENT